MKKNADFSRISSSSDIRHFSLSVLSFVSSSSWQLTIVVEDSPEESVRLKRRKRDNLNILFCFTTRSPKLSLFLSRTGTTRVVGAEINLLDDLPFGEDVKRTVTFSKLDVQLCLELCAFNFGTRRKTEDIPAIAAVEANPLLLSLVCDVQLIELRGLDSKRQGVAQVVVQHAQSPVFWSNSIETKHHRQREIFAANDDCTFFFDATDKALKIALQDKKGETLKSARLPLSGECSGRVQDPQWVELVPKLEGEGSVWLKLRFQISEEGKV
jgi:hypothetical protein